MISDAPLLKMVMEKHPDQDADFIMEQFALYKKKLMALDATVVEPPVEAAPVEEVTAPVEKPKKKRITKRSLKIKPENAIQKDAIICCICGKKVSSLTSIHLKTHGLTPDEYRKLCGYPPHQSLMSHENLRKVKHAVENAQKVRKAQKAAKQQDM